MAIDEKDVFVAALAIPDAGEREAYLQAACAGHPELLGRLRELLSAHEESQGPLDRRPVAPGVTVDAAQPEGSGTVIGPYKLIEQIGEGGMGTVFMAEQTQPVQRKVALKVIKPGLDSRQVVARFEAERQALALMDHVNIARVFDGGTTENGRPYFVMELVHGVPITKYCDDNHLTPRERLELFVPVCQAIQHAHQKGIIHRDVKPSNVMITLYDGKPVPKVIDFGVAKATEQKLTERTLFTQYGTMVGTLEYMSPEQAEMSALGVDTRSDIYSLGVLLYELLTGSTPLTHKRMKEAAYAEILRMIKEEEPPKPSTRLSDSGEALASISANRHTEPAKLTKLVRGELDWIVMKTLEKDRNRRYETAKDFAADVQRYLQDEQVQACPPSAWYRFRKFARRNRRALATAAVLAVAMFIAVAAVGGSVGWAARDRAARQAAVEQEANLAMKEAERWQEQRRWPEALSAAKRADGLLAGSGSDELRERVRQLRNDLEMVLRVEEIPLLMSEWKENGFDYEAADQAYAKAFTDYGIDVAGLPVDEAAACIRARANVASALVAALDDWAYVRFQNDRAGGRALVAVAGAAETDPWRRHMREAVTRRDNQALAALATSPELFRQPPTSLLALARAMRAVELEVARIEMLRRAQRQYPGDFWINEDLAHALAVMEVPDWDEVVSFRRAALAVRPQSAAVHSNLGSALQEQGKLDQAVAAYRKAIELDPKFARPHFNLGSALQEQGKLDQAIAACRKAIELDPKYAMAYNRLGIALKEQMKLEQAVAAYRKAIELDPKYARPHFNLGNALKEQGKLDQAVAAYREAIKIDPKYGKAYNNLGIALKEQGNPKEAIAARRKAVEFDPKNAKALNNLGSELAAKNEMDEAIDCFRKAIKIDPKYAIAYHNLGMALKKQGNFEEAIASYRRTIELDPKNAKAHIGLGVILCDVKGDYDGAVAVFRKAIELDPKSATAHHNLGAALERQRKLDEAIDCYRKAFELDPKSAYTRNGLVTALAKTGWDLVNRPDPKLRDPQRAVALAKEALELAPRSVSAWQYWGWIQYRMGNWKDSVEALEKSCKLQEGGDDGQWIVLALAHAKLAAQEGLSDKEREHHKAEARRRYEQADELIDKKGPVPPDPANGRSIWDFRLEARKLMGVKEIKK